jgi:hypothetical protein
MAIALTAMAAQISGSLPPMPIPPTTRVPSYAKLIGKAKEALDNSPTKFITVYGQIIRSRGGRGRETRL